MKLTFSIGWKEKGVPFSEGEVIVKAYNLEEAKNIARQFLIEQAKIPPEKLEIHAGITSWIQLMDCSNEKIISRNDKTGKLMKVICFGEPEVIQ